MSSNNKNVRRPSQSKFFRPILLIAVFFAGAGSVHAQSYTTPGVYTYTVGNYTTLDVQLAGGGGGGGGWAQPYDGAYTMPEGVQGGAGGAGGYARATISVTPGQSITFYVGAGGAGGRISYNGGAGGGGGSSYFSGYVAGGGGGGGGGMSILSPGHTGGGGGGGGGLTPGSIGEGCENCGNGMGAVGGFGYGPGATGMTWADGSNWWARSGLGGLGGTYGGNGGRSAITIPYTVSDVCSAYNSDMSCAAYNSYYDPSVPGSAGAPGSAGSANGGSIIPGGGGASGAGTSGTYQNGGTGGNGYVIITPVTPANLPICTVEQSFSPGPDVWQVIWTWILSPGETTGTSSTFPAYGPRTSSKYAPSCLGENGGICVAPSSYDALGFGSYGCTTATEASCVLPWGGTLASAASTTAYQSSSVTSPTVCTSETRTCVNGTLSGSYTNQNCTVTAPPVAPTCGSANGHTFTNGNPLPYALATYNTTYYQCSSNSVSTNLTFPTAGGSVSWICSSDGTYGGTLSSPCSASRAAAPACGPAGLPLPNGHTFPANATGYDATYYQCSAYSTPTNQTFPAIGSSVSWLCSSDGTYSGTLSGQCKASRDATPITGSCSVTPTSGTTGTSFTWSASGVSGGTGSYAYAWSGTDSLSGAALSVTKSYATAGTKTGSVVITSGGVSKTVACSTSATVTYVCTSLPANATAYPAPDNTGLATTTAYSYSATNTTAKCQFGCNTNYTWNTTSKTC
ncbi:MAG: glycine-rich domain-containing protein, partial [Candidatus Paceibacterota bacterium]